MCWRSSARRGMPRSTNCAVRVGTGSVTARCAVSSAVTASRAKKDSLRRRAGPPRPAEPPVGLVRGQLDLDLARLIFVDETWASTNICRTHGRAARGERLRAPIPHGHWKTTTFVAGLRTTGMVAPMVLDGPINALAFQAYVNQVLVPKLRPGDIVVMDNLSSHKGAGIRPKSSARAPACSTFRPIVRTSTPSRTPSPSSKPPSARRPNGPSKAYGPPSETSSRPSPQQSVRTTSPTQDMI